MSCNAWSRGLNNKERDFFSFLPSLLASPAAATRQNEELLQPCGLPPLKGRWAGERSVPTRGHPMGSASSSASHFLLPRLDGEESAPLEHKNELMHWVQLRSQREAQDRGWERIQVLWIRLQLLDCSLWDTRKHIALLAAILPSALSVILWSPGKAEQWERKTPALTKPVHPYDPVGRGEWIRMGRRKKVPLSRGKRAIL